MTKVKGSLVWLEPLTLRHVAGLTTQARIVKALRTQLTEALAEQGFDRSNLDRCVYVIRMTGDFVISYPLRISPVLYIGRGDAFSRLSSHLKRWLNEVDRFGRDVGIEVRVCRPRRKGRGDMFKYVEADLIASFCERYGCVPFFNSRRETSYEDCVDYTATDEKRLAAAIGVGSGKRPQWAIAPAPANKNYALYYTGHA